MESTATIETPSVCSSDAALAEQLLEVHVADVARVVVARDHDHPLAVDLVEVLARQLVLAAEAVAGQVAGDDHHVGLQLVDLDDARGRAGSARSAASRSAGRTAGRWCRPSLTPPPCGAPAAELRGVVGARRASAARTREEVARVRPRRARAGSSRPPSTAAPTAASVPASRAARRPLGERADEVLARHRQQQRPAQLGQLRQPAQQLDRLGRALGDVDAGVEHDPLLRRRRARARSGHALARGSSRTSPPRRRSRGKALTFGGAARVRDHERRAGLGARVGDHVVAQPAHVVDHVRARRERGARDRPAPGVHRHQQRRPRPAARSAGTTRSISSSTGTASVIGAARLAAHVHDRRARPRPAAGRARRARRGSFGPWRSENESGVALTMPMSTGRERSSSRSRSGRITPPPRGGPGRGRGRLLVARRRRSRARRDVDGNQPLGARHLAPVARAPARRARRPSPAGRPSRAPPSRAPRRRPRRARRASSSPSRVRRSSTSATECACSWSDRERRLGGDVRQLRADPLGQRGVGRRQPHHEVRRVPVAGGQVHAGVLVHARRPPGSDWPRPPACRAGSRACGTAPRGPRARRSGPRPSFAIRRQVVSLPPVIVTSPELVSYSSALREMSTDFFGSPVEISGRTPA